MVQLYKQVKGFSIIIYDMLLGMKKNDFILKIQNKSPLKSKIMGKWGNADLKKDFLKESTSNLW